MNDDDYELISKNSLTKLRQENQELRKVLGEKSERNNAQKKELNVEQIIPIITQEISRNFEFENQTIRKELAEIKEINKNTLNNILHKNEELEVKFKNLVDVLKETIASLSEITNWLQNTNKENISDVLNEIKEGVLLLNMEKDDSDNRSLENKLANIEKFMTNLRILLSQVKPNDFRPNVTTSQNNQPPQPVSPPALK